MASSSSTAFVSSIASPFRVSTTKLEDAQTPGDSLLQIQSVPSKSKADADLLDLLGDGIRCSCRHSKCSKMYCDCFANNRYCTSACACDDCENCASNEAVLARVRAGISKRNPHAFVAKVLNSRGTRRHAQGCRCTKSKCLKKYCECFREGMQCTSDCRCVACENGRESFSELPHVADGHDDNDDPLFLDSGAFCALYAPALPAGRGAAVARNFL